MRWVQKHIEAIGSGWTRWRRDMRDRWRPPIAVVSSMERPDRLRPHRLYVTSQQGQPAFGFMICPCGCREILHLRFFGPRSPRWSVATDADGRPSVIPSIWRKTGCESHFYLTRGRVHWC